MSEPTPDGGFWRLSHDDLAALLARNDLSWETARVYLALADLTIGYGNERDAVSLSQIANQTGIRCTHVPRALRELESIGLAGHAPVTPEYLARAGVRRDSLIRWVVWPAPSVSGLGTTPTAGNRSTPTAGNRSTPKATPEVGTHQDTKNIRTSKKGASGKPTPSDQQQGLLPDDQPKPSRKAKAQQTDPRVAPAVAYFSEAFERVHGRKPLIRGGKDGKLLKALPGHVSLDQIKRAVDSMLADKWGRPNASIGVLVGQWDRWLNAQTGGNGRAHPSPVGGTNDEPAYFRPAAEVLPQ